MNITADINSAIKAMTSGPSRQYALDWDDLSQETIAKVLEYSGEEPYNLGGWLRTIIRNVVVDAIRQEGREVVMPDLSFNVDSSGAFAHVEHRDEIRRVLSQLSEIQRNVVLLRSELSVGETATRLEISANMVMKHQHEARVLAKATR